jgi:hypothetical protein
VSELAVRSNSRVVGWLSLWIVVVFAIIILMICRTTGAPPGTAEHLPLLPSPL